MQGKEEETSTLPEVFNGAPYSRFAGSVVLCHILERILRHVHRPKMHDRPEDVDYGPFWKRHRELDTLLSSAFMFLPEPFRLPKNIRDPVAAHTNMNLHAAVICLHNAACEKADTYSLPPHLKQISQTRLTTAAAEIVNIVKITSHMNVPYVSRQTRAIHPPTIGMG